MQEEKRRKIHFQFGRKMTSIIYPICSVFNRKNYLKKSKKLRVGKKSASKRKKNIPINYFFHNWYDCPSVLFFVSLRLCFSSCAVFVFSTSIKRLKNKQLNLPRAFDPFQPNIVLLWIFIFIEAFYIVHEKKMKHIKAKQSNNIRYIVIIVTDVDLPRLPSHIATNYDWNLWRILWEIQNNIDEK